MKTDVRKLIHAYLDGELSAEEAGALIEAVKRDRAAGRELSALERLGEVAEQLPRPEVRSDFYERVLARADRSPSVSWLERLRGFRLQLSLPQLAVLAVVCLVAVVAPWVARPAPTIDASGKVAVQFVLAAPQATRVAVAGDFNGWNSDKTQLVRNADGTFRLSVSLPPGRYQYQFVVDGERWVPDPLAAEVVDDGFGGKNAVLSI
ncbi:MAG: zf-HC2 domain-containing protein [Deltaproteobacteria bacterium]|nr:zf-HC2 domain-containing protein [Deltaproteobacteria bacterium]